MTGGGEAAWTVRGEREASNRGVGMILVAVIMILSIGTVIFVILQ